jgi:hypothetical protein
MDLSSFICALRRFFSIRGPPSLLRCDRGTNFVGAKSELDEALKEMDPDKALAKYVVEQNCEWVFNPPHAFHFGGVWERQIATMFSDLGPCQLTHELFVTLMVEESGIVNPCLISTLPSDADQPQPLIPNMLLTMKTRPLVSPPGTLPLMTYIPADIGGERSIWQISSGADGRTNIYKTNRGLSVELWTQWKVVMTV